MSVEISKSLCCSFRISLSQPYIKRTWFLFSFPLPFLWRFFFSRLTCLFSFFFSSVILVSSPFLFQYLHKRVFPIYYYWLYFDFYFCFFLFYFSFSRNLSLYRRYLVSFFWDSGGRTTIKKEKKKTQKQKQKNRNKEVFLLKRNLKKGKKSTKAFQTINHQ